MPCPAPRCAGTVNADRGIRYGDSIEAWVKYHRTRYARSHENDRRRCSTHLFARLFRCAQRLSGVLIVQHARYNVTNASALKPSQKLQAEGGEVVRGLYPVVSRCKSLHELSELLSFWRHGVGLRHAEIHVVHLRSAEAARGSERGMPRRGGTVHW